MEMFLFVWLEGGFYYFVVPLLGFLFLDYGCVHVWFLEGVDFLESGWFFGGAAYYGWCLWLFKSASCFCVLLFPRLFLPSLRGLGFHVAFRKYSESEVLISYMYG